MVVEKVFKKVEISCMELEIKKQNGVLDGVALYSKGVDGMLLWWRCGFNKEVVAALACWSVYRSHAAKPLIYIVNLEV